MPRQANKSEWTSHQHQFGIDVSAPVAAGGSLISLAACCRNVGVMWVRLRLDIGWRDLLCGFVYCILPRARSKAVQCVRRAWGGERDFLVTLSVRSAFDLALRAVRLPPGSEVLLTALTVPDMVRIVEMHGLVPVPVDIDEQGEVIVASLKQAITPRSRMIVVAHLFGGRADLGDVLSLARQHNLLVVEDLAQGFRHVGECGHAESDLAMFSFGPIKTATALGGAVVCVKSGELWQAMSELLQRDPIQSSTAFARRLFRFTILKMVSGKRAAAWLRWCVERMGCDFDALANSAARGFAASNLLVQLRQQPSTPLLRLLQRRWQTYDFTRITRRIAMGRQFDARLGHTHAAAHTYWIFPILVDSPADLRDRLRHAGFDTTNLARMTVVPAAEESQSPISARRNLEQMVVLPWYPEMPDNASNQMAGLVAGFVGTSEAEKANRDRHA